jgi:hypothetical protein
VFVDAVHEVAPDVEVHQPWRRLEDVAAPRRVFAEAGAERVTVETEGEVLPLVCRPTAGGASSRIGLPPDRNRARYALVVR